MKNTSNKYAALLKDTMLFALSAYLPKLISFFLVPVYTSCLTTYEYGVVDLIATTISFLVPVLTLGIDNATLRFTIENKEDKRPYQISIKIAIAGIIIVITGVLISVSFGAFRLDRVYLWYFLVMYCMRVLYGINTAFIRAEERTILLSSVSILHSFLVIFSNIVTLVFLKLGIYGYLFSDILGLVVSNIVIFAKIDIRYLLKGIWDPFKELQEKMLRFSTPLVVSSIAWWINSASDKYFILGLCGAAANGIYSVAYKIPTILKLMQSVFSQAWLLSIYREYNTEGGKKYVGKIYDLYNGVMVMGCSVIILMNIPLSTFLYAKDFFEAWKYVPALLISMVFIANAGFYESILSLYKKSKVLATTTVAGAIVNIVLNIVLISKIGVQGAAIATVVGYFVMWVVRVPIVHQLYDFQVNWIKHGGLFALLIVQAYVMVRYQNYWVGIILCIMILMINLKTIFYVITEVREKLLKKMKR